MRSEGLASFLLIMGGWAAASPVALPDAAFAALAADAFGAASLGALSATASAAACFVAVSASCVRGGACVLASATHAGARVQAPRASLAHARAACAPACLRPRCQACTYCRAPRSLAPSPPRSLAPSPSLPPCLPPYESLFPFTLRPPSPSLRTPPPAGPRVCGPCVGWERVKWGGFKARRAGASAQAQARTRCLPFFIHPLLHPSTHLPTHPHHTPPPRRLPAHLSSSSSFTPTPLAEDGRAGAGGPGASTSTVASSPESRVRSICVQKRHSTLAGGRTRGRGGSGKSTEREAGGEQVALWLRDRVGG
jgi:hypothetical protein